MTEIEYGVYGFLGIQGALLASFMTMLGGRDEKFMGQANRFWGRFFSPFFFASFLGGLSYFSGNLNWWFLGTVVILFIGPRLPHRIPVERLIKAVVWCSAGAFICVNSGHWWLLLIQYISGISAQLIWGTKNPTLAPIEELGIYFSMNWLLPIMIL